MVRPRPSRQKKQPPPQALPPNVENMTLGEYLDALLQAELAELKASAEEALQKFDKDVEKIEEEIKKSAQKKIEELEHSGS